MTEYQIKLERLKSRKVQAALKEYLKEGWSFILAAHKVGINRYMHTKLLEESEDYKKIYDKYYQQKKVHTFHKVFHPFKK